MAPLVVIELSKQHSHFPNENIAVCKIYLKESVKPCSSPHVKIMNASEQIISARIFLGAMD